MKYLNRLNYVMVGANVTMCLVNIASGNVFVACIALVAIGCSAYACSHSERIDV